MNKLKVLFGVCIFLLVAVLGCNNGTTVVVELSGLTLSDGTLSPAFDASVTAYTATVPYETDSIEVTVSINSTEDLAVSINNSDVIPGTGKINIALDVGINVISVEVTYEGKTETYTVTVTREGTPEIKITGPITHLGADQDIVSGTTIDFGTILTGDPTPHDITFTIENAGDADLTLSATPDFVSVTGDTLYFLVTDQPLEAVIPPGETQVFIIRFEGTGTDWSGKSGTATIESDDDDEGNFTLSLTGVWSCG